MDELPKAPGGRVSKTESAKNDGAPREKWPVGTVANRINCSANGANSAGCIREAGYRVIYMDNDRARNRKLPIPVLHGDDQSHDSMFRFAI